MYVKRQLEEEILKNQEYYPVISVIGPRQTGKTTLVKHLFPDFLYYSLENPDTREFVKADPRQFLNRIKDGIIIDEVQRAPEILSYIQEIADQGKTQFILTGSSQLLMLNNITQTLAGRTAILRLLPFSFSELINAKVISSQVNLDEYILKGFYPAIYSKNIPPVKAYRNYYETYVERDVRQLINIKDLHQFQLFIRICAGRIGNLFNASSIANEIGVSVPTIKSWVSILEASFILFLLPPFHANISKRLIKTPKLYFYDVGLAAYLLGLENTGQVSRDPLRGALFENMVISEIVKYRYNTGMAHNLSFYRDSNHNEVDLIIKGGNELIPVEIKSSQTFHTDFLNSLKRFENLFKENVSASYLTYAGESIGKTGQTEVLNFKDLVKAVYG